MKNITYIFSQNRKKNYNDKQNYAKDFYYGIYSFENKNNNIEIIEFSENKSLLHPLLKFFDKFLNKFLSLPSYTSKLTNLKNLKKILNTDDLFLVNEGVGFSSILILFVARFFKRINVSLFAMGLYSKNLKFKKLKFLHLFFIKLLVLSVNNIIFLGNAEFEKAKNIHKKQIEKFNFLPFCIDTEFWKNKNNKDLTKNENIIFVGNDGNRDFELLIKLAESLKQFNFIIVSSNEVFKNLDLPNVKIHNGSWGSGEISDADLRNLYLESRLSIIPLKESLQPSGQSVALQSMSLGIPVMITETKGFWQKDIFLDEENIFFVNDFDYKNWVNKINKVFNDDLQIKKISKNAKSTVLENYKLEVLYKFINQICS